MQKNAQLNNPIAEAATLGACIADPNVIIFVSEKVRPEDFFIPVHRWIADAAWYCLEQKQPPTLSAVIGRLEAVGRWATRPGNGSVTMQDLDAVLNATNMADVDHAVSNAMLVRDLSFRRRGHEVVRVAAETFLDTEKTANDLQRDVLAAVGRVFDSRAERDASIESIATCEKKRLEQPLELAGVTCGMGWLDELTGGFLPTECWVIAAPYKMRKTTCALNMVLSAAESGAPVSVFTVGDSSRDATYRKLLAMVMAREMVKAGNKPADVRVSSKGLLYSPRTDLYSEYKRVAEQQLVALPIRLYDGRDMIFSLSETGRFLRRDVALYDTRIFFYDYAQAADCGREDYEKTTRFAAWMQQTAGELGICGVAISQVNEATVISGSHEHSPGAKGGGALPAMANVWIETEYTAPFMKVKLRLARDSETRKEGVDYTLHVESGVVLK